MVEIGNGLWCGNDADYEWTLGSTEKWAVVHACKEPYHRKAVGYTGRSAPTDSAEYLWAYRCEELCLNLVDAEDVKYIPEAVIEEGLRFIRARLADGKKVLVHCNQGRSRSAGMCMLYMAQEGKFKGKTFMEAEDEMRNIYPMYSPAKGMRDYLRSHWR
jgi:hypothetical protein